MTQTPDQRKCIIVLGFSITALSTLRCVRQLKKDGYTIVLAGTDSPIKIAWHSNIPDQKFLFTDDLVAGLLDIRDQLPSKPMLLITQDKDAVEISENREKLESYFTFLLSGKEVVEVLMEKTKFTQFALSNNLPVPATYFIEDEKDLRSKKDGFNYPVIIKPYLVHATKVFDKEGLDQLLQKLKPVNYKSLIVQDYISGDDDNLYFCFLLFDHSGKLVHRMIAQKLRQWPVSYGTTSLAKTVSVPQLEHELDKFIASVKLVGFCSIEYKYDKKRDSFFIMEPTIGRFNQQVALTAAAGVNFPLAFINVLMKKKVEIIPQKNEVFWLYESNDFFSFFKSPKKYGYLKILFKPHIKVLFSITDPLPLFREIQSLLGKRTRKIFRHV
jgi:D-aspartate ligase